MHLIDSESFTAVADAVRREAQVNVGVRRRSVSWLQAPAIRSRRSRGGEGVEARKFEGLSVADIDRFRELRARFGTGACDDLYRG